MRQLGGHAIAVRALERDFGPQHALAGVDLCVAAGEVHGLLGPSGAGKTTLLRVLAGQLEATGGRARVLGLAPDSARLRGRVAHVQAGGDGAYPRGSGLENLAFFARAHGLAEHKALQRAEAVLFETGLSGAARRPVGEWTPGLRRRLALARALLTDPAVLLVDEAERELDTAASAAAHAVVLGRAQRGTAVLWATQRLDDLDGLASSVTLLAAGRVRYAGTVAVLADRSTHGWARAARDAA